MRARETPGERVACVDVPALPLQLLARARPNRGAAPLAVVEDDHPQARILWVDHRARKKRVRVGMRYAAALQLTQDLQAAPVAAEEVRDALEEVAGLLGDFSPRVEVDRERVGCFWIDPSGLGGLFGPLEAWAGRLRSAVRARQLEASVGVGFARLPTWAVARTEGGVVVLRTRDEERRRAGRAELGRLEMPPDITEGLRDLAVFTVAELLALPRGEVTLRFGTEARRLHALYADVLREPMQARAHVEAPEIAVDVEPPDDDLNRLLFTLKGALHELLARLAAQALAVRAITVRLEVEGGTARSASDPAMDRGRGALQRKGFGPQVVRLEPARATRDGAAIVELLRLRLDSLRLHGRVERAVIVAETARLDGAQLSLFPSRHRDPDASARAVARLRAAFGPDAVVRAELRDAWLPEGAYRYVRTGRVDRPKLLDRRGSRLVRRVLPRPEALALDADGRPVLGGGLARLIGPYRLAGGWWVREVARDYHYAEAGDGRWSWLFRDRHRGAWYRHGDVE